jgi:23S rRNA A2030 N6-methylase RlmJ
MWKWLEDKLGITKLREDNLELQRQVQSHKASNKHTLDRVERIYSMMKSTTTVSADIQYKHSQGSTILVAGRYRDRDYVKLFNVQHKDMDHLVNILRDMEESMCRGYYDAPLQIDIKSWIDRE